MAKFDILINQFRKKDPKVVISLNPEESAIALIRGKLTDPVDQVQLKKKPFEIARKFIKEKIALLGGIDEAKELLNERVFTSKRGTTHVVFQQKHGDSIVLGGNLSIHFNQDGEVYLMKSSLAYKIDVPGKPKITVDQAIDIAKGHAGKKAEVFKGYKALLVIVDAKILHLEKERQRYYICWQLGIITPDDRQNPGWIYFIDSLNGKVLLRYSAIKTGTGVGRYSHGTSLNSEASGSTYRLRDTATSSAWSVTTKPVIHTFDDNGSSSFTLTNYSQDANDNWDNGGVVPANRKDDQRPEVDIHRFLGYVLSYYYLTHGYNGWDDAGKDPKGHAHNEYLSNNAFWYGFYQQIYFADGDGTTRDFMCPLDTVAHEFTHGVKYFFDILQTYDGETGALDEATSDLFGAFVALDYPLEDPFPWIHGNLYRLDGTSGRNMVDPSRDVAGVVRYDATNNNTKYASVLNGFYPDHYSLRYTGANDYHGVHCNCPIITHAFYLMINGGTHRFSNVTVTGIGVSPVEQMLFEVISTGLLDNSSDFAEFRVAMIQACQTLYPDNLDYLIAIKTAFYAVGIGPDLYIRDTLADQGEEPGTLSCMSPDIIVRQQQADAATLALISDFNNSSLSQDIKLGPNDHFVYFRLFNRGSVASSGTFRLFIAPVSTFPTPTTWNEVGHYDFPNIPADGGTWVPTAAGQCLTLSSALINTLGIGHFCFIGIIESSSDPAPDRLLINDVSEFHAFISKSNNYAWRNCNIYDLVPDASGEIPVTEHTFQMNGFGLANTQRDIEIDTRDMPDLTQIVFWIPTTKFVGLKAYEIQAEKKKVRVNKIAGALENSRTEIAINTPIPLSNLVKFQINNTLKPKCIKEKDLNDWRSLLFSDRKIVRLTGIPFKKDEKINVHFVSKVPKNAGTRDVTLVFREYGNDKTIGQLNYIFRIRKSPK
jgi:Zn-dependent metalloprotease